MVALNSGWLTASAVVALAVGVAGCKPATGTAAAPTGGSVFGASTAAAPAGTTTFTEPTQSAFTDTVPQGWTVKGGVQQGANGSSTPWIMATSPDGATTISIGDPSIPGFTLPSQNNQAGQTVQSALGTPSPVEPYENGVQFAGDYAQKVYGQACAPLQPAGSRAEPDLAQLAQTRAAQFAALVGVPAPPTQFDGGGAQFTCQSNGAAYVVGVIAVTGLNQTQTGGGFWGAPIVIGYRTPAASQPQTDQVARAMIQSYQPGAQWQAQMVSLTKQKLAAIQQQGAQQMAMLQRQEAQEGAMLNQNEQIANERLNAGHAAFMQQFNAQGDARNAAFAQQQYNKETGQQSEMRYINNQQCIAWYDAAHTRCSMTAQQ